MLLSVFWEVNSIDCEIESRKENVIIETVDEIDDIIQAETEVPKRILVITIEHKSMEEMENQYHFDKNQKKQLAAICDEQFDHVWQELLDEYD